MHLTAEPSVRDIMTGSPVTLQKDDKLGLAEEVMTGGRILFNLKRRLPDSRNTIFLGGYMVPGTRGRALQDGQPTIRNVDTRGIHDDR
jgi:predicted metal-dependent RNase